MCDGEAVQTTQIPARAVVLLKSWSANHRPPALVPPGLGGEVRLLSFSPGEWLVVSERMDGPKLGEKLERQVRGEGIVAVDLSSAVKVLTLQGPATRAALAKGCGLDLHPERFPAGHCARTRLAQLAVIVDCVDPAPRFDLYVGRSYVKYLMSWLNDAAVELSGEAI